MQLIMDNHLRGGSFVKRMKVKSEVIYIQHSMIFYIGGKPDPLIFL